MKKKTKTKNKNSLLHLFVDDFNHFTYLTPLTIYTFSKMKNKLGNTKKKQREKEKQESQILKV